MNDNEYIINEEFKAQISEKCIEKVLDTSSDLEKIKDMSPMAGYELKLKIISEANNFSAREKIDAINEAETKYQKFIEHSEMVHSRVITKRCVIIISCIAFATVCALVPSCVKMINNSITKTV